jgi:hypothetical protein
MVLYKKEKINIKNFISRQTFVPYKFENGIPRESDRAWQRRRSATPQCESEH